MFVDRNHQWNGATTDLPIQDYLMGGEYIMSGNDNRDNPDYRLDITLSAPALVYMLIDDRLPDGVNTTPPGISDTAMGWILTDGWSPVINGLNRFADDTIPDHVGADEGGDGTGPGNAINQWASMYVKSQPAGTFSIYQADNAGRNMYGVVVVGIPNNPAFLGFSSDLDSFEFRVTDGTDTAIVDSTITVELNGVDVTAGTVTTRDGGSVTVTYNAPAKFPPLSDHSATIRFSDNATPAADYEFTRPFSVGYYAVIPPDYAISANLNPDLAGDMLVYISQYDDPRTPSANSVAGLEEQLAGAMRDASGNIRPNVAALSAPPNENEYPLDVNYNVGAGNINDTDPQPDNFNGSVDPTFYPNADVSPFIDSADGNAGQDFVMEFYGWIELSAGQHKMGVNSDDCFKLSIGKSPRDLFGVVVGEFNDPAGRGSADTIFEFSVEQDGIYPFRLVWGQGGGGGNCEWFNVASDGSTMLINDPKENPIIGGSGWNKSFYTWAAGGNGRAAVTKFVPAVGYEGADPADAIEWTITAGTTSAVAGQTRLIVDGVEVISNGGASGTYTPADGWAYGSEHTGQLIWTETGDIVHTEEFNFTVRTEGLQDLGWGFYIELEDFNYNGGQTRSEASNMSDTSPYLGLAYSNLVATFNIDFNRPNSENQFEYREPTRDTNAWPIHVPVGGNNTAAQMVRKAGNSVITTLHGYKMGYTGAGHWYNYTRDVPKGIYKAFAGYSHGTAGTVIGADLDLVTAGATTENQTLRRLGSFAGAAPGGWGSNGFYPLRTSYDVDAPLTVFKLPGGPVTFRITARNGDQDYIQLSALAQGETVAPQIIQAPQQVNYGVLRDRTLTWQIEDFSAAPDPSTIKVEFGPQGAMADVTSQAQISKDGDITTITFQPSALMDRGVVYEYNMSFMDDSTAPSEQSSGGTQLASYLPSDDGDIAGSGYFLIEAEDFNTDGGQSVALADTMPYLGGAYMGLGGVMGIDYSRDDNVDDPAAKEYRLWDTNSTPAGVPPLIKTNDGEGFRNMRDLSTDGTVTWNVPVNYAVGWSGSVPNRWFNYSRQIPAGTYEVWGGIAVNNTAAGTMRAQLEQVISGSSTDQQVTTPLGVFDGGGTGTWGDSVLVPLLNNATDRQIQTVSIAGGITTLRWIMDAGDQDYLMLVRTGDVVTGPEITEIVPNDQDELVVTWTGNGMLQSAPGIPAASGDWSDVTDVSPATVPVPSSGQAYYRVIGN
jgi:hypothetical protein